MELQQSEQYATYIRSLHWQVERVDNINIFIRKFPLVGGFAKIQRISTFPDKEKLLKTFKLYNVKRLVLEAAPSVDELSLKTYADSLRPYVRVLTTPFIPTKTLIVDLKPSEEEIFQNFSEAKRRAVRRALKNNLAISEPDTLDELIKVKNRSGGPLGFITTSGARQMWDAFRPDNATSVIAKHNGDLAAGIFLIFWEQTAYYWIAGGTKKGKKLFAPTLITWEAMKISKKKGMQSFDFVGVWDERFPADNKDWLGFTKFKEGFGGKPLYYPTHRNNGK